MAIERKFFQKHEEALGRSFGEHSTEAEPILYIDLRGMVTHHGMWRSDVKDLGEKEAKTVLSY